MGLGRNRLAAGRRLLGVGYTVGYAVYTIGTLITAPETLNVGAALAGLAAVAVFAAVIIGLIRNTNKKLKTEYALDNAGKAYAARKS